jgi:5-dehydro-2-deoxygluconokinase
LKDLIFNENKPFDLISFGRVGIDIYPNDINCAIEDIRSFSFFIGGSPANTTVGASKLGLKTGFISKVADDKLARIIYRKFKEYNIDISGIVLDKSGTTTQIAIAEVASPDDSTIVFYRNGVSDINIQPNEIKEEYIANTKILHISGTALSSSPSREAVLLAMTYAAKHGVCVSIDIDYRPFMWKSDTEVAIYYSMAAEKCDIIIGTREEFDAMEYIVDPGNTDDDKTAQRYFKGSTKAIIIKHGKKGSYACTKSGEKVKSGIYEIPVVNTRGAGDSFASAFLYGTLRGFNLETCLLYAAASSSIVVSKNDCSEAMPSLNELEEFMISHAFKM